MHRSSTLFLVGLGVLVIIVLVLLLFVLPSSRSKKTSPPIPGMTGAPGPLVVTQFSEIPAFSPNRLSADAFIFASKKPDGVSTPYIVQGEGLLQYTISPAILESHDGKDQYEVFYNDLMQGYPVFLSDVKLQMILSLKGIDGDAAFEMLYNSRIDGLHVDIANADLRTRSLNLTLDKNALQMLALSLNPELYGNSDNSIPNPISLVIGIKDPGSGMLSDAETGTLAYDPASSFSLTEENLPKGEGILTTFNFPNISMVYKPRRNCIRLKDVVIKHLPVGSQVTFKLSTTHEDYPLWVKLRDAFSNMVSTKVISNSILFTVPEQSDKTAVVEGFFSILCDQLWNEPLM